MKKCKCKMFFLFFLFSLNNVCFGQDSYTLAVKEYFYGDLNKAVNLLTKSIEDNVERAKSYMYRGAANGFLKNFTKAINDLDSSAKLDSTNAKVEYYYGKIYLLQGSYELALMHYKKGLVGNPNDADCYDGMATIKILSGEFDEAINYENRAIELNSSNQLYFTNRGFAKSKTKKYYDAIEDYSMSLKLQPNHKAFADRGYSYSQIGKHAEAIDDYTRALDFYPDDSEILYLRGISYKVAGKKNEACSDFEKSAKLGNVSSAIEKKTICSW